MRQILRNFPKVSLTLTDTDKIANLRLTLGLVLSVMGLTACESHTFSSRQSLNSPIHTADSNQIPQQDSSQLDKTLSPAVQLEQPSPQPNNLPTTSQNQLSQNWQLSSTDYAICRNSPTPSICISQQLQLQQETESQAEEDKKIFQQRQEENLEQQEYEQQQAHQKSLEQSTQPQLSSSSLVPLNQPQPASTPSRLESQSRSSSRLITSQIQSRSPSTGSVRSRQLNNSSALPATPPRRPTPLRQN